MISTKQLDFTPFEWITFDCYGTLIDWETGILDALRPMVAEHGVSLGNAKFLELYGQLEAEIESESQPYISYRDVLQQLTMNLGKRLGFVATQREMQLLPKSLPSWKPFTDTVAALKRLKTRYKLGIHFQYG